MVYDITSDTSFRNLDSVWKKQFIQDAEVESKPKFPFLILGNKSDLSQQRQVDTNTAESWSQSFGDKYHVLFAESSAETGTNTNMIEEIAKVAANIFAELNTIFFC